MKTSKFPARWGALVLGIIWGVAQAQAIDDPIARLMTEGWRSQTSHELVQRKSPVIRPVDPVADRASLPDSLSQSLAVADQRFDGTPTRAVLIARQGTVIYERYAPGKADRHSTPIGYSMSKSLVSLAVGRALCDGHIPSLEARVHSLVPGLAGTSWGNASVADLLKMASGAFRTNALQASGWKDAKDAQVHRQIYGRQLQRSYLDLMREVDAKAADPGATFNYNNYDTIALNILVEKATGSKFSRYFEEVVWDDVGPEAPGAWVTNQAGEVAGYFGFSATPRDWLRIGLYVLERLDRDDCLGRYLKAATREQIQANWLFNRSYGYQIWTQCTRVAGSFCFIGANGQQLIFHPETRTVLYVHSVSTSTNTVWREMFVSIASAPSR